MASQVLSSVVPTACFAPGARRQFLAGRPQGWRCAAPCAGRVPAAICRAQLAESRVQGPAKGAAERSATVSVVEEAEGDDDLARSGFMEKTILTLAAAATPMLLAPEVRETSLSHSTVSPRFLTLLPHSFHPPSWHSSPL